MSPCRPAILTYHSLDLSGSVISISPQTFRAQMNFLVENRVPVVPLDSIAKISTGVALTFDDGFRNFFEHAFPVLLEHRLPATVFVVSDYCGSKNTWPSQPTNQIPMLELMDWAGLREIVRYGIELGAHTATHPRLTSLPEGQINEEMLRCRSEIEQQTGVRVRSLAYPYGNANATVRICAGKHFQIACGTVLRSIPTSCDPLHLPRIDAYYLRSRFWFESLMTMQGRVYLSARRALRAMRKKYLD